MESGNALVIMIKRRSSPVVTSAFLFYLYSREYAEFNTLVSSVRYDIIFRWRIILVAHIWFVVLCAICFVLSQQEGLEADKQTITLSWNNDSTITNVNGTIYIYKCLFAKGTARSARLEDMQTRRACHDPSRHLIKKSVNSSKGRSGYGLSKEDAKTMIQNISVHNDMHNLCNTEQRRGPHDGKGKDEEVEGSRSMLDRSVLLGNGT